MWEDALVGPSVKTLPNRLFPRVSSLRGIMVPSPSGRETTDRQSSPTSVSRCTSQNLLPINTKAKRHRRGTFEDPRRVLVREGDG